MKVHLTAATKTESARAARDHSSRAIVEQAEILALAEVGDPIQISALCAALSISERTLRKAFHRVHGLPPCRHLRMLRLQQARRALIANDSHLTTVTEIATAFGFLELGRFSVEYRKIFGESPSQTLNRASNATALVNSTADREDRVEFCA
ncbi:MAG: helix-turn-helix domain-containing protein [Rhizobiales bacterium]|nr:helix-turn-helix domain-containing protein [Hyphomicrobiales bacterium]